MAPGAFLSYSYDSREHEGWVKELAARLRRDGVNAKIDQWEVGPGNHLPHFMEQGVSTAEFFIAICTPGYKAKADDRRGGVGYEINLASAKLLHGWRGVIPILAHGEPNTAIPTFLSGRRYVDLRQATEEPYAELLRFLHGEGEEAPPLGDRPAFDRGSGNSRMEASDGLKEGQEVVMRPIVPSKCAQDIFRVNSISGGLLRCKKLGSGQHIEIPLNKLREVTPLGAGAPSCVELRGRLQWISAPQEWKFCLDEPASEFGTPRRSTISDTHSEEVAEILRKRGLSVRWATESKWNDCFEHGWVVIYDLDGCYLLDERPGSERLILIASGL